MSVRNRKRKANLYISNISSLCLLHPALLATCFMLVSYLPYSSILKMEATCSSKRSVDFQRTTRRCIPEDGTVHNDSCENFKSYKRTSKSENVDFAWVLSSSTSYKILFQRKIYEAKCPNDVIYDLTYCVMTPEDRHSGVTGDVHC
jgi:hypothetical protein